MTPDEARELLDGTTPGPWFFDDGMGERVLKIGPIAPLGYELECTTDDAALAAHAPALAALVAGMREEWGAERQVRGRWVRIVFAFNTIWTDDRDIAESAVDDCRDLGLPARIVRRYVTEPEVDQ